MADLKFNGTKYPWEMSKLEKILQLLGMTPQQLEDKMFQNWCLYCQEKSYILQKHQPHEDAMVVELSLPDFQNLLADNALFNYFKKMYLDCMEDFYKDTKGMKPAPNIAESRVLFNQCILECHRYFSSDLIKQARNKKIIHYVSN